MTGGGLHQVINPATGEVVADYALALPADVDVAVAAARAALPGWATATPVDRSAVLAKLAQLAGEHADELVAEEVSQTGKPVRLAAEFDVPGSIDNIDFFAGAARHLEGKATAEYSADHTSSIRGRPSASSRPSRRGTTRCRWRSGKCCPRWPPAARW